MVSPILQGQIIPPLRHSHKAWEKTCATPLVQTGFCCSHVLSLQQLGEQAQGPIGCHEGCHCLSGPHAVPAVEDLECKTSRGPYLDLTEAA